MMADVVDGEVQHFTEGDTAQERMGQQDAVEFLLVHFLYFFGQSFDSIGHLDD